MVGSMGSLASFSLNLDNTCFFEVGISSPPCHRIYAASSFVLTSLVTQPNHVACSSLVAKGFVFQLPPMLNSSFSVAWQLFQFSICQYKMIWGNRVYKKGHAVAAFVFTPIQSVSQTHLSFPILSIC